MSLQIRPQVSLKPYNSFAVEASASHFVEACNDQQVTEALAYAQAQQLPVLLLGGGSNLLLTRDVDALVLRMASRGIRVLSDDGQRVVIEAEAGEPWHPFVQWTLAQGFAGLENLSLIPGTVGAAPVQNIGAYGVELKDLVAGARPVERRAARVFPAGLRLCLPRQPVQARKWALGHPSCALCLEPRRGTASGLRPGASASGGAGHQCADGAGCQSGHLRHSQRKTAGPC